ncbi:MAG: transcriptional regulator GcvA [Gammaproteobacteria bacterium]|nr:transcriptional regulator GcvA [Gammaproteobacteria bacterium]
MRRLPSLNALRAFEAGARHLSFTRAARELSVTQTAISHQVRQLEDQLGVRLFERRTRELRLTPPGSILYPAVAQSLDAMAEAVERVRATPAHTPLTVSVAPTFGARWLAQRLGRFWRAHPDVALRLHHSIRLVDLARDEVDLAVRWGRGDWPGVESERLMGAHVTPLCSPCLLEGGHPLVAPGDLRHHTLIQEQDSNEWAEWLAASGVDDIEPLRGPVIDDPNVIIELTIAGDGVMLGSPEVMAPEIKAGKLVAPFAGDPDPAFAYYLVYLPGTLKQPDAAAFRDFLKREAGLSE